MFLSPRCLLIIERCSVYSLLAEIKAVREMVIIKADLNVDARASKKEHLSEVYIKSYNNHTDISMLMVLIV